MGPPAPEAKIRGRFRPPRVGEAPGAPASEACPRLAQKFSTAAVSASAIVERRSGVASSSSSCRFTIDPASDKTDGISAFRSTIS
jgi:hypothetical protein